MSFMRHKEVIARRNLQLCFTTMPEAEREALLRKNFESVGMRLIKTGIAWFWPDQAYQALDLRQRPGAYRQRTRGK